MADQVPKPAWSALATFLEVTRPDWSPVRVENVMTHCQAQNVPWPAVMLAATTVAAGPSMQPEMIGTLARELGERAMLGDTPRRAPAADARVARIFREPGPST